MKPIFFKDQDEFRKWLTKNHKKETEVFVGFYKVGSGKPSVTWSQAVDQALCFGWIDGVRRSIDEKSYCNRFTPRRSTSNWSNINIKKVEALTKAGLMKPAGQKAFELRKESRSGIYSFGNDEIEFSPEFEKQFKANKTAWKYFQTLAPGYRKLSKNWVMSAKQEATQLKRLAKTIKDSEAGTNQWRENKYNKK